MRILFSLLIFYELDMIQRHSGFLEMARTKLIYTFAFNPPVNRKSKFVEVYKMLVASQERHL